MMLHVIDMQADGILTWQGLTQLPDQFANASLGQQYGFGQPHLHIFSAIGRC